MLLLFLFKVKKWTLEVKILFWLSLSIVLAATVFPLFDVDLTPTGRLTELALYAASLCMVTLLSFKVGLLSWIVLSLCIWTTAWPVVVDSYELYVRLESVNSGFTSLRGLREATISISDQDTIEILRRCGFSKTSVTLRSPISLEDVLRLWNEDGQGSWERLSQPLGGAISVEVTDVSGESHNTNLLGGYATRDPEGKFMTPGRADDYCRIADLGPCGDVLHDLYGYCDTLIHCVTFEGFVEPPEHRSTDYGAVLEQVSSPPSTPQTCALRLKR